ncbi:MAG: sensor histidine kinase [Nitriliruptoraceae bacterium]
MARRDETERVPPAPADTGAVLFALSAANNDLADLLREMAQQQARLAAINEQQSFTLSMVAHDLRNPLGMVIGFSEVLQRTLADRVEPQDLLLLERIEMQGRRMLNLVDDLIDAAVLERGAMTLSLSEVDVRRLLERVAETHRAPASRKGIGIEVELPPAPLMACLDAARIEQVLDNLVANAVKYTPRDRARTVLLRAIRRGGQVMIEVADQGLGIEEAELDLLFEPFSRVHRSGTDGEPSTGLGLAISRSLVQAHDGSVTVSSEPGHGTTFTVWLPVDGPACGVLADGRGSASTEDAASGEDVPDGP